MLLKTWERVIPEEFKKRKEEYIIYLRHLFSYKIAENSIPENSVLLDVGSGEGYGVELLSKKAKKIVGIDVDKHIIQHSQRKYKSDNISFQLYDGKKIPFDDEFFHLVTCFNVIEHVQDDKSLVSEVKRVLRKDGVFILSTPNRVIRLKPGQKPWNRFHIREYSPEDLMNMLKPSFSSVKIYGVFGNRKITEFENERIRRYVMLNKIDVFGLRKLLPAFIESLLLDLFKKYFFNTKDIHHDYSSEYSLDSFILSEDNVEQSIDLIAFCQK